MTYQELLRELVRDVVVENGKPLRAKRVVVGGMGGSALPAYATRFLDAKIPLIVHRDYDLPEDASDDALYIAISYSGNTAETLSFARTALSRGFSLAVISSGGELLDFAKEINVPFVAVPNHIQPRNALFLLLRALLTILGRDDLLNSISSASFEVESAEKEADVLTDTLSGALPIFYASRRNGFLAYVSKIHINETAKMPAFANMFPELNHNEMQSFDTMAPEAVATLARFVLLHDDEDDSRITRRMEVLAQLMRERGRNVTDIALAGGTRVEKLVRRWYVMHLVASALAERRSVDPDEVPLVEDFKKRL